MYYKSVEKDKFLPPFLAELALMILQGIACKLLVAELALGRQLADRFLNCQIARSRVLADLHATVRASGDFISQARIRKEMRETSSAHQMPVGALK